MSDAVMADGKGQMAEIKRRNDMKRVLAAVAALAVPALAFAQGSGVDLSKAKLKNPASFTEKAPDTYKAKFETSKGTFVITVHRAWAPLGADRFYNLVKAGFYDDVRFFRVLDGFMAQVGMNGNPQVQSAWDASAIKDDPVTQSNKRGFVSFATRGPNTRTTQFFINFGNNASLDKQGFSPFGEVTSGMDDVVDKLYSGYGEGAPRGRGPDQGQIRTEGNAYLEKSFPKLDYVKKATIEK
ncbi:MAG TPA: peptidylprolyl isomerase [Vicinamibacterales bacterium]|nr:peptidylprolyl isomerase [Vicinamibacterales bacterium]